MTATVEAPNVPDSILLGLYLMEMVDASANFHLFIHDVDDDLREHVLGRLVENGWTREDHPDNMDMRGALKGGGRVSLWGRR